MSIYHCSVKHGSKGTGASGSAKSDYICREGKYTNKPDFEYAASGNMPEWAHDEPCLFWKAADESERANGRVFTEIEISLPRELTPDQRRELVEGFIKEQLGENHPFTFAIHNPKALDGGEQPHAHVIFSERKHDGIERDKEQFFRRANAKEPAKGGTAKDPKWNQREAVQRVREAWERHHNKAIEHSFLAEPVSCKSLKARGIDREPEPKLGPKGMHSPRAEKVKQNRADRHELVDLKRKILMLELEIKKDLSQVIPQQPPVVLAPLPPVFQPVSPEEIKRQQDELWALKRKQYKERWQHSRRQRHRGFIGRTIAGMFQTVRERALIREIAKIEAKTADLRAKRQEEQRRVRAESLRATAEKTAQLRARASQSPVKATPDRSFGSGTPGGHGVIPDLVADDPQPDRGQSTDTAPALSREKLIRDLLGEKPSAGVPPSHERLLGIELLKRPDIDAEQILKMQSGVIYNYVQKLRREWKTKEKGKDQSQSR